MIILNKDDLTEGFEIEPNTLINDDCLNAMKFIPDNSISMILTDPPYDVITGGNKGVGSPKGILTDNKQLMKTIPNFSDWLPECFRVLKPESHAYFMVNFKNLEKLMKELRSAGFEIHNLLVWEKNTATPNRWYMKNVEYTIFARKGKAKAITDSGSKTCHKFDNIRGKQHPTQKPIELMELYVSNSSLVGEVVLDPFMGSGTTGVACKNLNRKFIGIELSSEYFEIARNRIGESNE
jgi:site-specific DNA-methyltransferase (adenine-specific)